MSKDTTVIYNGACPICSREIAHYRAKTDRVGIDIRYTDLSETDLAAYGLTADDAARRLHVVEDGEVVRGAEAFIRLWRAVPGFGWLARLTALPGVNWVAELVYEWLLAPLLYALHRRRQARLAGLSRRG